MDKPYCCCKADIACYILGTAYLIGCGYGVVMNVISIVDIPSYWFGSSSGYLFFSWAFVFLNLTGLITTPLMMFGVRKNKQKILIPSLVQLFACFFLDVLLQIINLSRLTGYFYILFDFTAWNTYVFIFFLLIQPALFHAVFIVQKQLRDPQQDQQATSESIRVPTIPSSVPVLPPIALDVLVPASN